MPGKTGENLLQLMERRLDNVVFRLGDVSKRQVSATFAGLCGLVSAESVAEKRGKTVKEILG